MGGAACMGAVRVFGLSCNGSIKYLRFNIFLLSIFASFLASTIPSSSFIYQFIRDSFRVAYGVRGGLGASFTPM